MGLCLAILRDKIVPTWQVSALKMPDFTGRKPVQLNVNGTRICVHSWTSDVAASWTLLKTDDDLPEFLLETIPRYFKADLKGLRRGLQLKPVVFMKRNGSAMAARAVQRID